MPRVDVKDTEFWGTSRSFTRLSGPRGHAMCRRCGASLFGRRERRSWSTIAGVAYEIDHYRCPCGHGRQIRRPVELGAAAG